MIPLLWEAINQHGMFLQKGGGGEKHLDVMTTANNQRVPSRRGYDTTTHAAHPPSWIVAHTSVHRTMATPHQTRRGESFGAFVPCYLRLPSLFTLSTVRGLRRMDWTFCIVRNITSMGTYFPVNRKRQMLRRRSSSRLTSARGRNCTL